MRFFYVRYLMVQCRRVISVVFLLIVLVQIRPASAAGALQQSALFRAGGYFPASKAFDVGTGFDLAYSVQPSTYAAVEASIGYYRAESGATGFLSALPLTLSAIGILPLPYINIHAGGGVGAYYKMAGGTTELPADHSEVSLGYYANAGIEFPASNGLSLLLDAKYVFVNQGKFKSYDIKHDGAFLYGGFALNF